MTSPRPRTLHPEVQTFTPLVRKLMRTKARHYGAVLQAMRRRMAEHPGNQDDPRRVEPPPAPPPGSGTRRARPAPASAPAPSGHGTTNGTPNGVTGKDLAVPRVRAAAS